MSGQVYFIEAIGRIKVGYSDNVARRMRSLNAGSPERLTLLGSIPGTKTFERSIHLALNEHRLHGEWFNDCPTVRRMISKLIRRGQAAIYQPPKSEKPSPARERRDYQFVDTQAPWKAMAKKLDDLLARYEALIERMPTVEAREACRMFHKAHDEFEDAWMSAIDNHALDSAAALAGLQFWFDHFERAFRKHMGE